LNKYQSITFEFQKNRNLSDVLKEDYNVDIRKSMLYFKKKINEGTLNEYDRYLLKHLNNDLKELIKIN